MGFSLFCAQLERVQIMGNDRYIVAYTPSTLIVGDMEEQKNSEVSIALRQLLIHVLFMLIVTKHTWQTRVYKPHPVLYIK